MTDFIPMINFQPNAALLVEVYPIGEPGKVAIVTRNTGDVPLTREEAIRTLRSAIEIIEQQPELFR